MLMYKDNVAHRAPVALKPSTMPTPAMWPRAPKARVSTAVKPVVVVQNIAQQNKHTAGSVDVLYMAQTPTEHASDCLTTQQVVLLLLLPLCRRNSSAAAMMLIHASDAVVFDHADSSSHQLTMPPLRQNLIRPNLTACLLGLPEGSFVIRPAALARGCSLQPALVPFFTVGARPNLPAARKAVVEAIMICSR